MSGYDHEPAARHKSLYGFSLLSRYNLVWIVCNMLHEHRYTNHPDPQDMNRGHCMMNRAFLLPQGEGILLLTFGPICILNSFSIHSDPPPEGRGFTDPLSGTPK
jgi:hypothetical protein